MIVIKLIGGLGNQMYQYAYGLRLSREYGDQICLDTSFYKDGKPLALYNLNVPKYPSWEETNIPEAERRKVILQQKLFHVQQKLMRLIGRTDRTGDKLFIKGVKKGRYFNFDPYYYDVPCCDKENKYIYGYFQGEQYFADCKEELKGYFTVRHQLSGQAKFYEDRIRGTNAIAVHIRLGDYKDAANADLDVCTVSYYRKAIAWVCANVMEPVFYVFTNDPEKAKDMLSFPEGTVFIQGTKDYEDFGLMRQCKHFVLSNSTFSWWAAYLAENPEKSVTVPKKWRHSERDVPAIYMPYMTKLPIED